MYARGLFEEGEHDMFEAAASQPAQDWNLKGPTVALKNTAPWLHFV